MLPLLMLIVFRLYSANHVKLDVMLVLMPIHVILAHLDMYTMIKVISVK